MPLLRSRLVAFLFVALALAGFAELRCTACCSDTAIAELGCGHDSSSHSEGDEGASCQCVCHQSFLHDLGAAPFLPVLLSVLSTVPDRADAPPDAVPRGIDYPPQLA